MSEVTLSLEAMRFITAAEDAVIRAAQKQLLKGERLPKPVSQLKIHIRDCVEDADRLFFVVDTGQLGLALGRQAKNLQTLKMMFRKECKFIEYSDDPQQFLRNLFKPFRVESVALERIPRGQIRRRPKVDATGETSEGSPTGLDDEAPMEDAPMTAPPPGMTIVREGENGAAEAPAYEPHAPGETPEQSLTVPDEEAPDEVLVARVTIHADDKGKSIGKGGKNIKVARLIAKRHHNLWDVQVV